MKNLKSSRTKRSKHKFTLGTTTATASDTGDLTISKGTLVADLEGKADTADQWHTARSFTTTGDVVVTSTNWDGSGNFTAAATIQASAVDMAMINASGTASGSTYLRGDGSWQTVSVSDTTYSVSCVDGDNSDEEKIRLTSSGSVTDDVVIEAGTGLSIARSGDKITLTNTVSDTNTTYSAGSGLSLSGTTFSVDTLNQNTTGTADHVTITDNESTNENNLIPFVEDAGGAGSRGLESDGDFHYNPSTGTVTATIFEGAIDGGTF